MNEPEVYDLLFPEQARARDAVAEVDYARVHCELQRVGVNQRLLWRGYVDESGASGKARLSYGSFCRGYAAWVSARNVTNHLEHKPGQAVEVDWSLSIKTDNTHYQSFAVIGNCHPIRFPICSHRPSLSAYYR